MRYISVKLYTSSLGTASNGGVSETNPDRLCVPCTDGNLSEMDIIENGYSVLILMSNPYNPGYFVPLELAQRHTMAGGSFIWTTDSRFRRVYGDHPIALHDRVE